MMSDEIYQKQLLRLAADAVGAGQLDQPDAKVTVDNPLCGDRITLEIKLDENGRVIELAHKVRACVLCQASASVVGGHAKGHDAKEIAAVAAQLEAILKKGENPPDGEWAELDAFTPVAGHKSRHICVMLPFQAISKAFEEAGAF